MSSKDDSIPCPECGGEMFYNTFEEAFECSDCQAIQDMESDIDDER